MVPRGPVLPLGRHTSSLLLAGLSGGHSSVPTPMLCPRAQSGPIWQGVLDDPRVPAMGRRGWSLVACSRGDL